MRHLLILLFGLTLRVVAPAAEAASGDAQVAGSSAKFAPALNSQQIEALQRTVDTLISGSDDVKLRRNATEVYQLIDALLAVGRDHEASR